MYDALFSVLLRRLDPESAHRWAFGLIRTVAAVPGLSAVVGAVLAPPGDPVRVFGREVPGRLGLAAGFDKDATGVPGMTMLGFGFVEVGTITPRAQPGNEPPRLWRLVDRRALRNRMGFNNAGAQAAADRLRRLRSTPRGRRYVVGVNIGKNKTTTAEDAAADYAMCARMLAPWADYLVVNVSSPNTPGLRDLQSVDALRPLLVAAREAADAVTDSPVPILVKIAPDLADSDVLAAADLVVELDLAGVVAVNTTIAHDWGDGGLSGPPLFARGLAVVRLLRERLGPDRTIIGVGGISTGDDARAYLDAGADLIEGYTALIYNGPLWARRIHKALTGWSR